MKAFVLMRMTNGTPDLPAQADGKINYVLCDRIPDTAWGAYLVSASGPDLLDLDQQWSGFVGIVAVSDSGDVHWGELENPCPDVTRNKINGWLSARDLPTIPESWSNRQVVRAIFKRANVIFEITGINVSDIEES